MAKKMKTYRLEQLTLNRLSLLAKELGLSETAVIETAVMELYRQYWDNPYPRDEKEDLP